jgi:hypothetical protein
MDEWLDEEFVKFLLARIGILNVLFRAVFEQTQSFFIPVYLIIFPTHHLEIYVTRKCSCALGSNYSSMSIECSNFSRVLTFSIHFCASANFCITLAEPTKEVMSFVSLTSAAKFYSCIEPYTLQQ